MKQRVSFDGLSFNRILCLRFKRVLTKLEQTIKLFYIEQNNFEIYNYIVDFKKNTANWIVKISGKKYCKRNEVLSTKLIKKILNVLL